MIPVSEFRKSLEKNASVPGKVLKVMWDNPKTTAGIVLGTGATLAIANMIHPLHQIASEERKRGLMKDQRKLLKDILLEQRKGNEKPVLKPKQKLIINPLS